jgi:hypothetical protein
MYDINSLGPLRVVSYRQGRRVRIATTLAVGDTEFPAPENPRLLLVPANVAFLQQMWDALRMPSRNNLLVTGESGSGKTTLVRYLGEIYRSALSCSVPLRNRKRPFRSYQCPVCLPRPASWTFP